MLTELLPQQLEERLESWGEKKFRASQVLQWLYRQSTYDYDAMSNVSKALREKLKEALPFHPPSELQIETATDGTTKIAYELDNCGRVEAVLIPTSKRLSLCVSSELGCQFNCAFCRTAKLGFKRSLTAGEILGQVHAAKRVAQETLQREITNIVFMGMGEPLNNLEEVIHAIRIMLHPQCFDFSRRKITLSTVGHVPGLQRLARENLGINLAISLHSADDTLRSEIMPANRAWGLEDLFKTLKAYPLDNRQRITFEYILIQGLNHGPKDANLLVKRLHGIPSKVNLIPFNTFDESDFQPPTDDEIAAFQAMLLKKGLATTLRKARGDQKLAACGQLGKL